MYMSVRHNPWNGPIFVVRTRGDELSLVKPIQKTLAEIDPALKDKFGIPVLRFHWKWSAHEIGQAAHMHKTAAEIIDAMGGRMSGVVR